MILIDDLTDAWMADMKSNIEDLGTVDVYEGPIDIEMIKQFILRMPAVLLHYDDGTAIEDQRDANGASGMDTNKIGCIVAAASMRSKKERQLGAHILIDQLRSRYNGFNLTVKDKEVILGFVRRQFVFQESGLIFYYITFQYYDNPNE